MEVDEDDIEQPSSSDNKATKKRFEVKKVRKISNFITIFNIIKSATKIENSIEKNNEFH